MNTTNPFEAIDLRLSNIESLLQDIKLKSIEEKKEENLTIVDVAKILLVSKQSVYSYIRRGEIKAKRVGRTYIINRADLDNAIKEVKSFKYKRIS